VQQLSDATLIPQRDSSGAFVFMVDHCFGIKGQGTIMTGTVLQGAVAVGDVRTHSCYNE
jgi:selenocysteine-specific elongation factor